MARFKPYLLKRTLKKYRFAIFTLFLLLIVAFLWYQKIQDTNKQIQADYINKLATKTDFESCKELLKINENNLSSNKYIKKEEFLKNKQDCLKNYDIANISFKKDVCSLIVNSLNKQNLEKYFLKLDDYEKVRNKCISKYLNLKFSDKKWLNKALLFDVKLADKVRYKDKINIDLSVFNNTSDLKNIVVEYWSKRLALEKKRIELQIDKNSLKNYSFVLENTAKSGVLDLNFAFYSDKSELLERQNYSIEILKSPEIGFSVYKYWKTSYNNPFIDADFEIKSDYNKEKSNVKVEFYNNSLIKISDLYSDLKQNKITNSFYNLVLLNSTINLMKLWDKNLEQTLYTKEELNKQKQELIDSFADYRLETGMFSLRKNTQVADFTVSAFIYTTLKKLDIKKYDLENLKKNLYYYINDNSISLENRLNVMMILSEIDDKVDLRFIEEKDVSSRHNLITYTYALFKTGPVINDDLIKININKIKNLLNSDTKNNWFYSSYTDKLLFLNFLLDYNYYDKNYILSLFDEVYQKDFSKLNTSFLDTGLAIRALQKKNYLYENTDKTKYGFMLGLARNTEYVFWLWWAKNTYEIFDYRLSDLLSLGDKKLEFRAKKLLWKDFKANIRLSGEYKNLKDNIKNNQNVAILREIYKKDETWKYILLTDNDSLKLWEDYKIVDKIRFVDKRPRKNIVIKDFMPSSFEFLSILWEDNKYNSFENNSNYLEFQYASYWGSDITISYLVKLKNTWEFFDSWLRVYMMFDDSVYWESENKYIKVVK